jgi:hypothetical protein
VVSLSIFSGECENFMQGTRGEPPQTVKTMENLEKEAIIELKYSLHKIGLTSASSEHVLFI